MLNTFKDFKGRFYIIGSYGKLNTKNNALKHETAHGLFYTNSKYKAEVREVLERVNLDQIDEYLKKKGYHKAVFEDEDHAYILCEIDQLKDSRIGINKFKSANRKLEKIFQKYVRQIKE